MGETIPAGMRRRAEEAIIADKVFAILYRARQVPVPFSDYSNDDTVPPSGFAHDDSSKLERGRKSRRAVRW